MPTTIRLFRHAVELLSSSLSDSGKSVLGVDVHVGLADLLLRSGIENTSLDRNYILSCVRCMCLWCVVSVCYVSERV